MFAQRANEAEPEMSWLFHLISNSFCIERSECIMCYIKAVNFVRALMAFKSLACRLVVNLDNREHSGKGAKKVHAKQVAF